MITWGEYLKGKCGPAEFVRDVSYAIGLVHVSSFKSHRELVLRGSRGEMFIPLNGEDSRKVRPIIYIVKKAREVYISLGQ